MDATYLSCADTAELIRAALKRASPATKFSVRSHTYSGGASIDVDWTDGPADSMVSSVTNQYRGGGFDGSIDLAYSVSSWLKPDGSAVVASCSGTEGSRGGVPAQRYWMPQPDCRLVRFGADFVFTHRRMSPGFAERVCAKAKHKYGIETAVIVSTYDGSAQLSCADWADERRVHEMASRFIIVRA